MSELHNYQDTLRTNAEYNRRVAIIESAIKFLEYPRSTVYDSVAKFSSVNEKTFERRRNTDSGSRGKCSGVMSNQGEVMPSHFFFIGPTVTKVICVCSDECGDAVDGDMCF